jgi:hypothetical protein
MAHPAFAPGTAAAACLLALLPAGPARAQTFCSEPAPPFCVNQQGLYEDSSAADRCGRDVRTYAQGMRGHAECLRAQAEEALVRAEQIRRRDDCMRESRQDCR